MRSVRFVLSFILIAVALSCAAPVQARAGMESFDFKGREVDMFVPQDLPQAGARSLLVILHGGGGNSNAVRHSLKMDGVAEKYGFLVAYLNGDPMLRSQNRHTWNAGECCGISVRENDDDVGYIVSAIREIERQYGVSPSRVYGMGHSNGAMMTQRVMCETGIYQAAVPVSGPLELDTKSCPAARGKRILAIHGAVDKNVPINGGRGIGVAGVSFNSEANTKKIYENSGASYTLWVVDGADHHPKNIIASIAQSGGSMQEAVVKFLGLQSARHP